MRRSPSIRRWIAGALAVAMVWVSLPVMTAQAGMVSTEQVVQSIATQQDMDRVRQFMARQEVRRQMESWGVDPQEAAERVGGLTDTEIAGIAAGIDQVPAGQDAVVAVISAGLVIFLVIVLTDSLGYTDVLNFVDSAE